MGKEGRITAHQIAAMLGVSQPTVSRALRGDKKVNEDTRARIVALANELNYTVEQSDGSIDISKAIKINEEFQVSTQFWSYLVKSNLIRNPQDFIMPSPHMSLVEGEKNVTFFGGGPK